MRGIKVASTAVAMTEAEEATMVEEVAILEATFKAVSR
jgi:hypothetical protein